MYIKKGKKYPSIKKQLQDIKDFMENDDKLHLTDKQVSKIKDYIIKTISKNFVWNETFGDIIDIWESKLNDGVLVVKYYTKILTCFGYDVDKYMIYVSKSVITELTK